ncbi:MAG: hypothetical protein V4635_01765 [Bacteroidota bacterium]
MAFTGNESEIISLADATAWTAAYRSANPTSVKAHFFGKTQLMKILDQDDCAGIRAYYAIDDEDAKQLVLVGVNFLEKDQYTETILDRSHPCPNACDSTSPLY